MEETNPQPEEQASATHFSKYEEPATILDPAAPIQEPKSKIYAYKTIRCIWRSVRNLFRWQNLFAAVIAGATLSQYFMSEKQWKTANEALKQNDRLILQSEKSANAAARSVAISESSSRGATEQFRLEQRAWISLETAQVLNQMKAGETLTVDIVIRNTGKTPAKHLRISRKSINRVPVASDYSALTPEPEEIALAPGGSFTKRFRSSTPFPPRDIDMMQSGALTFYLFGEIAYYDAFGRGPYKTGFCTWYSPKDYPALRFCGSGNYIQ